MKNIPDRGFTLLEMLVSLLLLGLLICALLPALERLWLAQQRRLVELESWQSAAAALDKLGREFQEGTGFLDTTEHPLDGWHLSWAGPSAELTYYVEGTALKRKMNASQAITDDRTLLNTQVHPALVPFEYPGGGRVIVRLLVNNGRGGQRLTASFVLRNGSDD